MYTQFVIIANSVKQTVDDGMERQEKAMWMLSGVSGN